jgi:hypothetical protein
MGTNNYDYFLSYEAFHKSGEVYKAHVSFNTGNKRINSADIDRVCESLALQASFEKHWDSKDVRVAITSMFLL